MSTLDNATGHAQSAANSVDEVITGLDGAESELDDAISQFQAVGVGAAGFEPATPRL